MRLPALAVALVLHGAALRDDLGRFELEVGENQKVSRKGQALHSSLPPEPQPNQLVVHPFGAEAFIDASSRQNSTLGEEPMQNPVDTKSRVMSNESCKGGILHVKGKMVVKEELIFSKDCSTVHGDLGSQVFLEAPLIFEGALRMKGSLSFGAAHALQRSCVTVEGHASVLGNVRFQNCHNANEKDDELGQGGCLHVSQISHHGGTMNFNNCSSGRTGGGLYVDKDLLQQGGSMEFYNCSSSEWGGGLYVDKDLLQQGGSMEFYNCSSQWGGGLWVDKDLSQLGGSMEFYNCRGESSGGGLYINSNLKQENGTSKFHNCSGEDGGGLYVNKDLLQLGGSMEFYNCRSKNGGGGLFVKNDLSQQGGSMEFHKCYSGGYGGGLSVQDLSQQGGSMEFHKCCSEHRGGGLFVKNDLSQQGGSMGFYNCTSEKSGGGGLSVFFQFKQENGTSEFHNCSSDEYGGGLYVRDLSQEGGSMGFYNCSSVKGGGGLQVIKKLSQQGGSMGFYNCSSVKGGGLSVKFQLKQENGTMKFHNCRSRGEGGGLNVDKFLSQQGGHMNFHNCSSERRGGGLHVIKKLSHQGGTMKFNNCSSMKGGGMFVQGTYNLSDGAAAFNDCTVSRDGGGLWVEHFGHFQQPEVPEGGAVPLSFHHCRATRGGGIFAVHKMNAVQPMHFHQCRAAETGAGIQITGIEGSDLARARFENCSAARGTAILARNLTVQKLELVDTFDTTIATQSLKVSVATFQITGALKPELHMVALTIEIDSKLDCTEVRECGLWVYTSSQLKVPRLVCGLGAGVSNSSYPFGCMACAEGYTQIENATSDSCLQCPDGSDVCRAAKIQMKPGLMLHKRNLSRPLHCPTKKVACPGGELPVNDSRPMCKKGYGEEGCAKCVEDNGTLYLMSDANVLVCTPCAKGTVQQFLQWCSFLGQRAVLFAVSAASIFGAGRADRVKSSGVYLNQLMAFASVSGIVVTSVMQTETADRMKSATVQYLYGTATFISDASSGQGVKSSHCLLSYLSLEHSGMLGVHCLDVAVSGLLVLILSFKDWRVALVAGLNCFLPSILADFAKYVVCYRLEEDKTGGIESLICDHLPFSNLLGFVTVGTGFLIVFAVALFAWIRLSNSQEAKEDEEELPSHEAFLTNKYGEGCRYFEAERLVRKVLLATAAALCSNLMPCRWHSKAQL